MELPDYYPYRSQEVRDACLGYFDSVVRTEWPADSGTLSVPTPYGQTLVRTVGPPDAPPLVLLHGAGATSLMWRPNIRALSRVCLTYAIDQVGEFGCSTCSRPVGRMEDLLSWLDSLFDGLNLEGGINLAGMSYGGALAAQYALHAPRRLRSVILLAPGNTVLRLRLEFYLRVVRFMIEKRRGVPAFVRWVFADMSRTDPAWASRVTEEMRMLMRSMVRRPVPMPPVLTDEQWANLSVPTLFLVGEHEVIYSPGKALKRLARVAPRITARMIPGAGHDMTFAQAEMVNRMMLDFLALHQAA